ncbi:MAG TPA: Ig domain-containing protein, partial [Candidatus Bathyarchaeia archaeon]|nr:Ig domain-containing protein [Candidatus Bathyarchaeia archaeon]
QTITGRYSGDPTHGTASGSTTITLAKRQTTVTINCTSPVELNQASTCTVTVTDVSPGSFAGPRGTVSFTSSVTTSSFNGNGTCLLVESGSSSSCQISYTQTTNTSKPDIFGTYPGDSNHSGSTGNGSATIVNPPILSVPGAQTVVAGSTISFIVNATDGSRAITIAAVTELPSGATFDSTKSYTSGGASSIFTWTPTGSQAGNYTIVFKADDGQGGVSTASVTIHVTAPTNAAPLPLLSYSIFGLVGFLAVIGIAVLLRRFQMPRKRLAN